MSDSFSLPCDTSCATAVFVKILLIEPMLNRVSTVLDVLRSRSASPKAFSYTGTPALATSTTPLKASEATSGAR